MFESSTIDKDVVIDVLSRIVSVPLGIVLVFGPPYYFLYKIFQAGEQLPQWSEPVTAFWFWTGLLLLAFVGPGLLILAAMIGTIIYEIYKELM